MESHETLDNVEEMKGTLKEILNVLQDIQKVFKKTVAVEPINPDKIVVGDEEFLKALNIAQESSTETSPSQEPEDEVV